MITLTIAYWNMPKSIGPGRADGARSRGRQRLREVTAVGASRPRSTASTAMVHTRSRLSSRMVRWIGSRVRAPQGGQRSARFLEQATAARSTDREGESDGDAYLLGQPFVRKRQRQPPRLSTETELHRTRDIEPAGRRRRRRIPLSPGSPRFRRPPAQHHQRADLGVRTHAPRRSARGHPDRGRDQPGQPSACSARATDRR